MRPITVPSRPKTATPFNVSLVPQLHYNPESYLHRRTKMAKILVTLMDRVANDFAEIERRLMSPDCVSGISSRLWEIRGLP